MKRSRWRAAGRTRTLTRLQLDGRGHGRARATGSPTSPPRASSSSLFSLMAVSLGADFLQTGRLTGLLLLASEALVVVLTVMRAVGCDRRSQRRARAC